MNEKIPQENEPVGKQEKYNPNSIGDVLDFSKDLLTSPDKVYRSVSGKEAIDDLEQSGVVRNKQSTGLVDKSRWGDKVFWSKGREGAYHVVQEDGFVIEAPLSVAQERVVTREDVTAIYEKIDGEVKNILDDIQNNSDSESEKIIDEAKKNRQEELTKVRKELGLE